MIRTFMMGGPLMFLLVLIALILEFLTLFNVVQLLLRKLPKIGVHLSSPVRRTYFATSDRPKKSIRPIKKTEAVGGFSNASSMCRAA